MDNIYDGAIYDTEDRESQEDLVINSCGYIDKQRLTVTREKGRKDFHLIYVVSGQCEVEIDGKVYSVGENSFAIYYPHQKQLYFTKQDCARFWIHFTGTKAEKLLCDFGFKAGIYTGKESHEIKDLFREMSDEYLLPCEKSDIKNCALLQMLFLRLYESITTDEYINPFVSSLVKHINNNCRENINVKTYADKAGMGEESFCHLFRKSMGIPLHKYITKVRMKEALRLLRYSSISISQIAYEVGYDDPLYFSRIFKKYYGISPKFARNGNI